MRQILQHRGETPDFDSQDGFSWQRSHTDLYWYSHSGWVPGYQSIANFEENIDAAVVLFLNNTGGNSEKAIADTYSDTLSLLRQ